jgi:hypothetical protein
LTSGALAEQIAASMADGQTPEWWAVSFETGGNCRLMVEFFLKEM